jgi:hypothetical protein
VSRPRATAPRSAPARRRLPPRGRPRWRHPRGRPRGARAPRRGHRSGRLDGGQIRGQAGEPQHRPPGADGVADSGQEAVLGEPVAHDPGADCDRFPGRLENDGHRTGPPLLQVGQVGDEVAASRGLGGLGHVDHVAQDDPIASTREGGGQLGAHALQHQAEVGTRVGPLPHVPDVAIGAAPVEDTLLVFSGHDRGTSNGAADPPSELRWRG